MTPRLRKLLLTLHITFSVGWIGALTAFLALNIAALSSQDPEVVRSAYLGMTIIGHQIIVPLSLAALATGLVQAMSTEWGLVRHRWVLTKLILTLFAVIILLVKVPLIGHAAQLAICTTMPVAELHLAGMQLAVHAAGGLVVLVVITVISVVKPWGRTTIGRNLHAPAAESSPPVGFRRPLAAIMFSPAKIFSPAHWRIVRGLPVGLKVVHAVIGIGMVVVMLHLTGHGHVIHG